MFVIAALIVMTGVDPIEVVEYSIISPLSFCRSHICLCCWPPRTKITWARIRNGWLDDTRLGIFCGRLHRGTGRNTASDHHSRRQRMSEHHLDIVRQVLDRQVVDKNHIYCGKVDNIVIDLKGKPKITAILVGNGPASDRLPEFARWLSQKLFGRHQTKIAWEEILVIKDVVKLASEARRTA